MVNDEELNNNVASAEVSVSSDGNIGIKVRDTKGGKIAFVIITTVITLIYIFTRLNPSYFYAVLSYLISIIVFGALWFLGCENIILENDNREDIDCIMKNS